MGKTHLLYAIGNKAISNFKKIKAVSIQDFTSEYINAIQNRTDASYIDQYLDTDFLLIDDIHLLEGKSETQKIFCHLFDSLYLENKQIVLTSEKPITELKEISKQLISRGKGGLLVTIKPADYHVRVTILSNICSRRRMAVSPEVIKDMAKKEFTDVREMERTILDYVFSLPDEGNSAEKKSPDLYNDVIILQVEIGTGYRNTRCD